jgi:PKD repeat protein
VCGALAVLVLAVGAQAASATVYCVITPAAPPSCTGTNESTLGDALTAASADTGGSDQIVLPAGTQTGPSPAGYVYNGSAALTVTGQGASSVITVATGSAVPVFSDQGTEPSITLQSLEVMLPSGATGGGVSLNATATVTNVAVRGASGSSGHGVALSGGGTLKGDAVAIPAGANAVNPAVFATGPGAVTVRSSALSDRTGFETLGPGKAVIHQSVLAGTDQDAAVIASGGQIAIDDSLLLASGGASGLEAYGSGASIVGAQLTIVGDASVTGVLASSPGGGGPGPSVRLSDTIIAEPLAHSIAMYTAAGASNAAVSTDYSDYNRKTIVPGGTFTAGAHDTKVTTANPSGYEDPKFTNPAGGNYELSPSSPLLGLDPTALGGTVVGSIEPSTDLAGLPRITGSGRDLGAYQHQPPTLTAAKASPTNVKLGHRVSFTASAKIVFPKDTLKYSWRFSDGTTATGASVKHKFKRPGTHTATITVTDQLGYTASRTLTVKVTAKPAVSHLSQHRGTIGFTLNEKATVRLVLTLSAGGKSVSKTFKFAGQAGRNHFKFTRKQPPPGSYSVTVTVTATASGHKSEPRTLRFTL